MSDKVTIISKVDETKVIISKKSARLSGLIKNLVEEYNDQTELEIPEIAGRELNLIAKFLEHYEENDPCIVSKPLAKYSIAETYGKWDEEFIHSIKEKNELFELLKIARFIDCQSLLELGASKAAIDISGYTTHQQFLDYFELKEDLTDDEVKQIEEEFEKKREIEREEEAKTYEDSENKPDENEEETDN